MLIVDGSARRRSAIRDACEANGAAQVVGEAGTGEGAVRLTRALTPDVVLLRLRLPNERDGVLLCRDLKDLADPPLVVLYDDRGELGRSGMAYLLSGADGFAPYVGEGDPNKDPASSAS